VPKGISVVAGENDSCYWRDVWSRRHLFALLVWRDVSVRYKQAVVGVAWAVLRPLIAMVIFAWIFGRVIKVPSGGLPYALLVLTGLLPWQLAGDGVGVLIQPFEQFGVDYKSLFSTGALGGKSCGSCSG